MTVKEIPPNILQELRFQRETEFRYMLYKRVEFPFLQSVGVNHVFQSFVDEEYGYIGTLHLSFTVEDNNKYWKGVWYEVAGDVIDLAERLQSEKIYNEDLIVRTQMDYIEKTRGRRETGVIVLS